MNIRNKFEIKNADVLKLKALKAPCEYEHITLNDFQPKVLLSKLSGNIDEDEEKIENVKEAKKPVKTEPNVSPQKNIKEKVCFAIWLTKYLS